MKKFVFLLFVTLLILIIIRTRTTTVPEERTPTQLLNQKISETHQYHTQQKQTRAQEIKPVINEIRDPDFLILDQEQSLLVSSFMIVDDYAIGFGDILVAPVEEILELERVNQQPKIPKPRTWPKGLIPYVIDPEVDQVDLIQKVIRFFHQQTPIRFIERTDQEDYVTFLRGSEHCFAHLGRIGGPQKVVLSELCGEIEIAHELMHTLGFIHEQNREDRDEHLQIFWRNIDENFHEQFKKIPSQFDILKLKDHPSMSFSFETIMIYHPYAFSIEPDRAAMLTKDGKPWSVVPSILGPRDIERIKLIYGEP